MTWIEDRVQERTLLANRNRLISQFAERTFGALWEQVEQCIGEATLKGIDAYTNGSVFERSIFLNVKGRPGSQIPPKELTVTLDRAERTITVKGLERPLQFTLEVGAGDVVQMHFEGNPLSYERAAEMMLDPFLFPDLPRKSQ
jgi:hypothetical protein